MPAADPSRPTTSRRWERLGAAAALSAAVLLAGCSAGPTVQEERSDTYGGPIALVVLEFDDQRGTQIGTIDAAISARVVGADRDGVQVDRTLEHAGGGEPEERIDQDGDTVTVTAMCQDGFTIGSKVCRATYEIQVPYGTAVQAATQAGSFTVEDTRAAAELRSRDGEITVTVTPDGTGYAVDASSQDGETTVDVPQDPAGVPIRAASDSGDVTVRAATP